MRFTLRAIAITAMLLLAGGVLLREVPQWLDRNAAVSTVDMPELAFEADDDDASEVVFALGQEQRPQLALNQREVIADGSVTLGYWTVFALLGVLLFRGTLPLGRLLGPVAILCATAAAGLDLRESHRVWILLRAMRSARDVTSLVPGVVAAARVKWALLSSAAASVGLAFVLRGTDLMLVTGSSLLAAAAMGFIAPLMRGWPVLGPAWALLLLAIALVGGTCAFAPDEILDAHVDLTASNGHG